MIILWVVVNHEDDDHDEDGKDGDGVGVGVGDIILPEHLVPPLYCSPDHSWQRGQRDDGSFILHLLLGLCWDEV